MKRPYCYAFKALEKIGCPVFENYDDAELGNFKISAEQNSDECWADYYSGMYYPDFVFGVNPKIVEILKKYGLYAQWENPGCLGVYE